MLTAVQHGRSLRWDGIPGDAELTAESHAWLVQWLVGHGVDKQEIEGGCGGPRRDTRHRAARLKLAQIRLTQGNAYVEKGELDRAIAEFTEALQIEAAYAQAYCKRGLAHQKKGNLDGAIKDFDDAIWLIQQRIKYPAMKQDTITADFEDALGVNNENLAHVYHARGLAYEKRGETTKAEQDFTKAEELGYKPR